MNEFRMEIVLRMIEIPTLVLGGTMRQCVDLRSEGRTGGAELTRLMEKRSADADASCWR